MKQLWISRHSLFFISSWSCILASVILWKKNSVDVFNNFVSRNWSGGDKLIWYLVIPFLELLINGNYFLWLTFRAIHQNVIFRFVFVLFISVLPSFANSVKESEYLQEFSSCQKNWKSRVDIFDNCWMVVNERRQFLNLKWKNSNFFTSNSDFV